ITAVYQRVVDNRPARVPAALRGADVVCDIRVVVFDGEPEFAYLKYRPVGTRFANVNAFVELTEVDAVLTDEELERVRMYCSVFGLDYGEIDVVRDVGRGCIYVLDINKTPLGPP